METSDDTHKTESIETRTVSSFAKIISIILILFFVFTPIYKIVPEFIDCSCWEPYLYLDINAPFSTHFCEVAVYF